jgi:hypothetical protein
MALIITGWQLTDAARLDITLLAMCGATYVYIYIYCLITVEKDLSS